MGDEKSGHLLLFFLEKGERLRHCNRLGSTPLGPRIPRSDGHIVFGGDDTGPKPKSYVLS